MKNVILEFGVCKIYENLEISKYYEISDKVDIDEECLDSYDESDVIFGYSVVESMSIEESNVEYLVVVMESDRVVYMLLDGEYKEVKCVVVDDVLNYL